MKFNLKNVFLSVGMLVFVLGVFGFVSVSKAEAAECTFSGATDNDWHTTTNWGGCGGLLPQANDSVIIPTAKNVTMSGNATITALTFNDAVNAANSITIGGTISRSLTVTGATTYTATTGTAGATLAVGAATFSTGTLVITDGAGSGDHTLSVSTGSATVTGHVSGTWTTPADVIFLSTGAGNMYFGGNFPSGGTLTTTTTGTITFNGTGAQSVGAYTTYNNVVILKTLETATLLGTTTFGGTLTLTDGNLDTNTQTFTVTGASSITDTITFGTGTKTFTGDVTLNAGAVWNETGAAVVVYGGNLANAATTFTASTGLHTFGGATKVISGATTTSIASVRITGATSNTGTLTVATLLDVADGITLTNTGTVTATTALSDVGATGTFVNSDAGTLNLGGLSDIGTLTATATGNTVNYTQAGAQTVFATAYRNLGLSGSGAKTMTSITTLTGNFSMSGSATATSVITTIGGNVSITGTAVWTNGAANVVTGTLTVGTGAKLTMGNFALTISSTSDITGTVDTATGATGTKTFTGAVLINSGGSFSLTGQDPVTSFGAGITNNSVTAMNMGSGASTLVGNLAGTGAITFEGALTIASGTTTNSNTGTVTVTGLLTLDGAWTQGTNSTLSLGAAVPFAGAGTFTPSGSGNYVIYTGASAPVKAATYKYLTINGSGTATVDGTTVADTISASSDLTNNASLTVNTLLAGGTVTNAAAGTLYIGGAVTVTTLTATATGNTVNYTAATPTCKVTTYDNLTFSGSGTATCAATSVTGDLTLSGTVSLAPSGASLTIGDVLTVGTGTTFTLPGIAVTVTGATSVTGILNTVTAATGTKTFTGAVTINALGTWDLSTTNPATSFAGGITMSGTTFNNGTGAAAFSVNQALAGAGAMTFGGLLIPAGGITLTNNNTGGVTVSSTGGITLAGNFTQGTNSILALAAATPFSGAGTFDATTNANTVNYTGVAPTVKAVVYRTLGLSGSGAATMTGVTTIGTNFNMSGSATATPVITTVGGNVSITGTAVMTTGAINVVTGTLTVGTGATLTMGAFALTIGGISDITGTINTTSATGTKTFTGAATVNTGGVWDFSTGGPAVSLAAGLTVDGTGTFSSGAGVYTFANGAAQTLGGTRAITITTITNSDTTGNGLTLQDDGVTITTLTQGASSVLTFAGAIPTITTLDADTNTNTVQYTGTSQAVKADTYSSLTVNGGGTATVGGTTVVNGTLTATTAITNNSTLTVTTALAGLLLTNGASATLNLGGTSTVTTLTATAASNTVNYTASGAQTVKDPATEVDYVNLGLSGSGAKSIASNTDVSGNITMGGTAKITLLTDSLSSADKLYFGTSLQRSGTWGAAAATATNETDTYFTAGVTYHITVASGSSSSSGGSGGGGGSTINCGSLYTLVNGACVAKVVTPVVIPAVVAPGCSGGNLFNTSTGAACVNNAVIPQGCSGGNLFNTSTGAACPVSATPATPATPAVPGVSSATPATPATPASYNFGISTLKNGSKGEGVKELQRFLNVKLNLGLVIDGKLGPKTIAVIKTWQKNNGLVADGLVGAKTKAKMNAQ
ncbi:MAG: peptidoglycan-binding protein [Candidatus Paceibacterota bacterium]